MIAAICTTRSVWLVAVALLAVAPSAQAAVIVGGSALLSAADANQLETWLGEGPIQITNIFTKQHGNSSLDFHAAADGKGRSFAVLELKEGFYTTLSGGLEFQPRQVIGGYNPQSWSSIGNYNLTPLDADRTAFLFNLTFPAIQRQNSIAEGLGQYQTYNEDIYGPTFGGGFDLSVDNSLSVGYSFNASYGGTSFVDSILNTPGNYFGNLQFGQIEVFTISAVRGGTDVPEPSSLLAWSVIPLALGLTALRRRRQTTV